MKNSALYTTLVALTLGTMSFGQMNSNKLWVTIENEAFVPTMINGKLQSTDQATQALINEYAIISAEQAIPDSRQEKLQKVYEIDCLCNRDELSEVLERSPNFTNATHAPQYEFMAGPDDYQLAFNSDYALDLIGASHAWEYSQGDSSIVLGISDGSFYQNHEELSGKYVSVINATNASVNYYHHGTAVAVTAAGGTNNAQGKSAIGYDCNLALNTMGYNQLLQLSYGGARVVNASWASGCFYSSYFQDIIDELYNNGTIVVASAGNGGTCGGPTALVYPAALDHVIAVSSVGPMDNHERHIGDPNSTHQHNSSVDLCAPGYDVALTVATGWYMTGNGTSFAAPYVTGTIGLMLALRPCLRFEEVQEILKTTAVNIDAQNPNYSGMLGAGRLDAGAALEYVSNLTCGGVIVPGDTTTGNGNGNGNGTGVGNGNGGVDPSGDGNNGHGNDDGNYDPSNPGNGGGQVGSPGNSGSVGGTRGVSNQISGGEGNRTVGGQEKFSATIYPNPSDGVVNVSWNQTGVTDVQVIAMNGTHVLTHSVNSEVQMSRIALEQKGVYFVRLFSGTEQLWTEKLVRL